MALFKPGWMSENEQKALKAIEKLTDEKNLLQAALQGASHEVRAAAVRKISDNDLLLQVTEQGKDHEVILAAAERMTDPDGLIRVLEERLGCHEIREIILPKLLATEDEDALFKAAGRIAGSSYADPLVKRITDPDRLTELAILGSFCAFRKIGDPDRLRRIAAEAESGQMRKKAMLKIGDRTLMAEAAMETKTLAEWEKAYDTLLDEAEFGERVSAHKKELQRRKRAEDKAIKAENEKREIRNMAEKGDFTSLLRYESLDDDVLRILAGKLKNPFPRTAAEIIQVLRKHRYNWVSCCTEKTVEDLSRTIYALDNGEILRELYRKRQDLGGAIRQKKWEVSHADENCIFGHRDEPGYTIRYDSF